MINPTGPEARAAMAELAEIADRLTKLHPDELGRELRLKCSPTLTGRELAKAGWFIIGVLQGATAYTDAEKSARA